MQESVFPMAEVPRAGMDELGTGSSTWVGVADPALPWEPGYVAPGRRCQPQELTRLLLASYLHALSLARKRKMMSLILPSKRLRSVS